MYSSSSIASILALTGLVGTLFLATPVKAQLLRDADRCDCEDIPVKKRQGYLINEEKAIQLVNQMLVDIKKYAPQIRFKGKIKVIETDCPYPSALLCTSTANGEERLITYNNEYLNRISKEKNKLTWVDWHVLAHEVGHHVLGHLDGSSPINPAQKALEKEPKTGEGEKAVKGQNTKQKASDRHVKANQQAKEIEADFFAVWLLMNSNDRFSFRSFITSFDSIFVRSSERESQRRTTTKNKAGRSNDSSVESASHPFFGDRLKAMTQFWDKLQAKRVTLARAHYFSDAANAAYVELQPERVIWDLGFVAGMTVAGKPVFTSNGLPVAGLLYSFPDTKNWYAGLNISRFKWHSPLRYEADVAFSSQRYGTMLGDGSSKRLIETLDLRYLTVFPKVTWSPLGRRSNQFVANRIGFFASAGPTLRLPLGIDYTNSATTVAPANVPTLQVSVSPRVTIGIELLRKTIRAGAYKLAVSYECQNIQLNTDPHPKTKSHNLDVTLQYNFARW
ncbi:hypothetical protein [Spirosoma endbachense]|uniref:Uncharacterized protein n=1 Tax=Spirosoma endbachense TaxID=2666025 RepID=A0A6P1W8Y3_9BACT|nr:hypothetical protein [Spirosoma endbachense]QHW00480.1 hypothetical protein GJR95_38075 [Spirosoma endbachense]